MLPQNLAVKKKIQACIPGLFNQKTQGEEISRDCSLQAVKHERQVLAVICYF